MKGYVARPGSLAPWPIVYIQRLLWWPNGTFVSISKMGPGRKVTYSPLRNMLVFKKTRVLTFLGHTEKVIKPPTLGYKSIDLCFHRERCCANTWSEHLWTWVFEISASGKTALSRLNSEMDER